MSDAGLGKVLVTGGGGFLGSALIRSLKSRGLSVRSLARNDYPHLRELGVEQIRGDIGDADPVLRAVSGCETVFHTASKAGLWGTEREYYQANVVGVQNLLAACRASGSRRIIYTSSPSVVFTGKDMEGADETTPYSAHFEAAYPRTKALAEQAILAANSGILATVALRPHLIWGPGDNNILPRFVVRARTGRLKRIGPKTTLIDPVYIDNAVEGHLLAADRLEPGSNVAGKAYFITQGETIPLWDMVDKMLQAAQMEPVQRSISRPLAVIASGMLEAVYTLSGRRDEPAMTRFMAKQLSTTHWFCIDAARRDLGYEPRVGFAEGLRRLQEWLKVNPIP